MRKYFLLCILLLCSFTLQAAARNGEAFFFSNLSMKDGLSQISVVKILQDSKGFMWFATRNGLNRYDGREFQVYKHIPNDSLSLTHSNISALAEDRDHNLWVGTMRGLNRLDLKTNHIKQYTDDKYETMAKADVRSLFVDSKGRLWVGTAIGLYLYVKEMDVFQRLDLNGALKDEIVQVIYETADNRLLIGTATKGVYVCDLNLKLQKHYSTTTPGTYLPYNGISALYEDSSGRLWGGSGFGGLFRLDMATGHITTYTSSNSALTSNSVRCLAELDGMLLVGTFDGLYSVNLATNAFERHAGAALEKGNLNHFSVYSLFVDRNKTVWVGTYAGGVSYANRFNNRFNFHDPTTALDALMGIYGNMVCTDDGNLYVATEGRGLLEYNLHSGKYSYFPIETTSYPLQYSRNIVKSLYLDGNTLWCGTSNGAIYHFDMRKKKYQLYYQHPNEMSVYAMLPTEEGTWIVGTDARAGLMLLTPDKHLQKEFPINGGRDSCHMPSARCLLKLPGEVLLIGTRNDGLLCYDVRHKQLTCYDMDSKGSNRLMNNYVTSLLRDVQGRIWVGTFGGGIAQYDEQKGIVKNITDRDGLIDNDICAIVEDRDHRLWISANTGISEYNPEAGSFVNYSSSNGIGVYEFTPHSGTLLPSGEVCFSGNNGFVTFNPEELQTNSFVPPLVFTRLTVNNHVIEVGDETNILQSVLDDVKQIDLNYDQNNLSIGYCAMNFIFARQNQYAVYLEGYDKHWQYIGNRREAYYTNLAPGTYVFQVKASNNDGVWGNDVRSLRIVVHPPVWGTWYAYSFYIISFVAVLTLIMYYIVKKQKLERELHFKQKEQRQIEEFHQAKIRMFTNFSHELRTPLTLVIAPLQELVAMPGFTLTVKNKLGLIYSNVQRLLLLVNQLMDLRKNQEGKLNLHIVKSDMYPFLLEIYYAFNHLAAKKSINFVFEAPEKQLMAWFDKAMLEKVVFNLLSNAMKFTPNGGSVCFSMTETTLPPSCQRECASLPADVKFVRLVVSDTGKGIPEMELKNIFAPFYQGEDDNKENVGTGIGLSLTRSIVHLHKGAIRVMSNQPTGTIFEVYIPISASAYASDEIVKEEPVEEVISEEVSHFDIEKKWSVLLAEDNDDVRKYVKESLEPYFFVVDVDNGEDALRLAYDKYPDLILSDIMMPRMDGLELCSRVKNDVQLGHIPVILMTAKSMMVHIKEGFSMGADDYIVKPFSMDVLIYRIKNLLESREKLRKLYGKRFTPEAMGIEIAGREEPFMQRFFEQVEKTISDPKLDIEQICAGMGMSRSNLYRKMKAVTELTATELIRNKRLEVAAQLLIESNYTLNEVASLTGFTSQSYFSISFKNLYGYSPAEFVKKHKESGIS